MNTKVGAGNTAFNTQTTGHGMKHTLAVLGTLMLASQPWAAGSVPQVTSGISTLEGTAWQLVAIQSMDDAQGTTKIAVPSRFTLQFGADGHAVLRLDCNRGNGKWEAKPALDASATSGSLSFGPIATTRARCAPPNLDVRLARDLGYVRSYLLKDGKLYLSLMADGGIYEWQPLP